ncbi:MAG TPA: tetratricopeptide repeat protein [Solirubrobacterales bacterium]|nr:tetratricopeptide repeat protein [Solirubrobacterales bacterium]
MRLLSILGISLDQAGGAAKVLLGSGGVVGLLALIYTILSKRKEGSSDTPAPPEITPAPDRPEISSTLPAQPRIIGRESHAKEIAEKFTREDAHTVLMHGPPGIGKTVLSVTVAHRLENSADALPEVHTYKCISAKASDPSDTRDSFWLLSAMYGALGFSERPRIENAEGMAELLSKTLGETPAFFVIDNFESVDDPTAIEYLQRLPRKSRNLLTSRFGPEPSVSVPDYPVPILDLEFSKALLREELGKDTIHLRVGQLTEIAGACGGIPFVIKSVAGLLAEGYSAAEVLEVLEDGEGDIFERLFSDHWTDMDSDARRTLCAAGLLGDTFSRTLLDQLVGSRDAATTLIKRRLVELKRGKTPRCTLHPLTRTFARKELETLGGREELLVTVAGNLTRYIEDRRLLQKGRTEYRTLILDTSSASKLILDLDEALRTRRSSSPVPVTRSLIELYKAISVPLWTFGDWKTRVKLSEVTLRVAKDTGHWRVAASAAATIGIVKVWQGYPHEARSAGTRAVDLVHESDDPLDSAMGERVLALAAGLSAPENAEELIRPAVAKLEEIRILLEENVNHRPDTVRFFADWPCRGPRGHESGVVALNQEAGILLLRAGQPAEAAEFLERSRSLATEIEDREGESISLSHLGRCAMKEGRTGAARTYFEDGLKLARSVGRESTTGRCLLGLAELESEAGRNDPSRENALRAAEIFERLGMSAELETARSLAR